MSSLGIFDKETKTYQKIAGEAEAAVLDTAMSDTSKNPVQNKVVKSYVDDKFKQKLLAQMDGDGETKYCQLCTIKITKHYINTPIEITVQERGRNAVDVLTVVFSSTDNNDPTLYRFKVFGEFDGWYISKRAASTWVIYGLKNEPWADIGVVDYIGIYGVNVTWDVTGVTELPDSKTKAVWGCNVNHANSADSATSVPWSGVTGKPSTYTPSSHTHSYFPLSGGTVTGSLHLKNNGIGSYNENIRMHPSATNWTSIVMCGDDNTTDAGTSAKTWGIFTYDGEISIAKNGTALNNDSSSTANLKCDTNNIWKANGNTLITSANIANQSVSSATTVNGHTVESNVPANAKFTDTTYEVATTTKTGIVKPDGSTITVDEDGTLHGVAKVTVDTAISSTSTNPVQNKVIKKYVDDGVNMLKKSVSDGKTKVANAITDKGVETATDATFDVMAENIRKIETGGGELHGATLAVSATDSVLFGQTVTLILNGANVGTTVFSSNGTCSFVVQNPGTYIITCGKAHNNVIVASYDVIHKTVISVELSLFKIVAFDTGTGEEIAKMIQAHYNNKINIADYWAVGDTKTVPLSAMPATGVGESHRAQTVQLVILGFEHDDLATAINGHSKAAVSIGLKDCLMDATSASNPVNGSANTEKGYMNSTDTNVGGWKNCARRTWCNNVFFSALPSVWRSMVKTVNKKVSVGNSSSTIETVQDKIFLAAEIEIFGSTTDSFAGEGTQYQYYKNATANIYKMPKWNSSSVSNIYWGRSPRNAGSKYFCGVSFRGKAEYYNASVASGIAPCLCI